MEEVNMACLKTKTLFLALFPPTVVSSRKVRLDSVTLYRGGGGGGGGVVVV